jgi:hypothetical protein
MQSGKRCYIQLSFVCGLFSIGTVAQTDLFSEDLEDFKEEWSDALLSSFTWEMFS